MTAFATLPAPRRSMVKDLGYVTWAFLALGGAVGLILGMVTGGPPNEIALVICMGVFFAIVFTRLIIAMVRWPERRIALGSLTGGLALWAAGSMAVSSAGSASGHTFPSAGEWLFLASYVGFAAFVVLDAGHRRGSTTTA